MMYNNMERTIMAIVSCLILCVTSCTSVQDPEKPMTELKFDPRQEISRASVTTGANFKSQAFMVFGEMKFTGDTPSPSIKTIFNGDWVSFDDSNDEWTYASTQYWFPKYEYSFVGIHPAGVGSPSYTNSALSLTYTLPDNFAETRDIMAATHRRKYEDYQSSTITPVRFGFSHMLSRLVFNVKNDAAADRLVVSKIELEGVNKTGSFTISPAPLLSGSEQTDDYNISWTDISNKGNIITDISVDIPEDEVRPLFPDGNALLVIPQPDNRDVIMHITYTLYDGTAEPKELTMTAQMPIGGWESGKIYTYTLFIEEISSEIYVTVSVKQWQTPSSAIVPVPES